MGLSLSDCRERCGEECDKERKCYVDQNEVKIGALDVMNYPQGTRLNPKIGQHSLVADLAAAALPGMQSSRSTTASSDVGVGLRSELKPRLKPQSVSWAEGIFRQTNSILNKLQLTPKASSFATARPSQRDELTFEQQMHIARGSSSRGQGGLYPR